MLNEGYEDIADIGLIVRVDIDGDNKPTMLDILTDIRGIPNVITVTQDGPLGPAPEGKYLAKLNVTFDDDELYDVPDLESGLLSVKGIDLAKIKTYNEQEYNSKSDMSESFPFSQTVSPTGELIREFNRNLNQDDLIWHQDQFDRRIEILEVQDNSWWQLQLDNQNPTQLKKGMTFDIRAGQWHRLLKGNGNLKVRITEASNLGGGEMKKRPYRFDIFLDKMRDGTAFTSTSGNEFTIPMEGNEALVSALVDKDVNAYKAAFKSGVVTGEGDVLTRPTIIKKTGEFGGIGSRARLQKEDIQIDQINQALENIGEPVDINLGNRVAVGVVACQTIAGTPKADAALVDENGKEVGYISLKYANQPSQTQQWGGITKYNNTVEVTNFIIDVENVLLDSDDGRLDTAYYRVIKEEDLGRDLVYGDHKPPENSVDIVIASSDTIEIVPSGDRYEFKATNIFTYPNLPTGDWQPTLYATYRNNRNDLGLSNTRVGCYTLGYRRRKKELPNTRG